MKRALLIALVLFLSASLVGCTSTGREEPKPTPQEQPGPKEPEQQQPPAEDAKAAVTTLVKEFGVKLQKVSLLAPPEAVGKSMQENYGGLVTPELLSRWSSDPAKAPGRTVSSPWPDRIEILSTNKLSDNSYEVQGEIIEVTSQEVVKGGVAAKRPITVVVEQVGDRWLITAVTLGAYQPSILYKNSEFGFNFSLPTSWQGYTIVPGQWEGASPSEQGNTETGPVISIRHPQWTQQAPRQDIPIMIFTTVQWNRLQAGEFHIGAAPINPSELGRNSKYVFALPARYNYVFPPGFEEVESILAGQPLHTVESGSGN